MPTVRQKVESRPLQTANRGLERRGQIIHNASRPADPTSRLEDEKEGRKEGKKEGRNERREGRKG